MAKETGFDEVGKKTQINRACVCTSCMSMCAYTFQKKNLRNLKFVLKPLKLSLIHVTLVHREKFHTPGLSTPLEGRPL